MAKAADVSDRIDWVEGDLTEWVPEQQSFHLVVCLYVHMSVSVDEFIHRMGKGVAPEGTLLLVGNRAQVKSPGVTTAVLVSGQTQVTVEDAARSLDPKEWELRLSEHRLVVKGVDSVICARRRN